MSQSLKCMFIPLKSGLFVLQFKCCGVHGVEDWKGNVPVSCCRKDPCDPLTRTYWQEVTPTGLYHGINTVYVTGMNNVQSNILFNNCPPSVGARTLSRCTLYEDGITAFVFCLPGLSLETEGMVFQKLS